MPRHGTLAACQHHMCMVTVLGYEALTGVITGVRYIVTTDIKHIIHQLNKSACKSINEIVFYIFLNIILSILNVQIMQITEICPYENAKVTCAFLLVNSFKLMKQPIHI